MHSIATDLAYPGWDRHCYHHHWSSSGHHLATHSLPWGKWAVAKHFCMIIHPLIPFPPFVPNLGPSGVQGIREAPRV